MVSSAITLDCRCLQGSEEWQDAADEYKYLSGKAGRRTSNIYAFLLLASLWPCGSGLAGAVLNLRFSRGPFST